MFIITHYKNLSMYRLMIYYLSALLAAATGLSLAGVLPYTWWHIPLSLAAVWLVSMLINRAFARLVKTSAHHQSELITALILTSLIGPVNPLTLSGLVLLAVAGAISQAGKYIFAYRKKHIFNPAGLAVLITALFLNQGASWWIGDWHLLPVIIIGGYLILKKLRWFHLALSFLTVYLGGLTLMNGVNLNYPAILAPLLFFATVMLIEPLTAPTGQHKRILYGIFIAVIFTLLAKYTPLPYTLELALLVGNFVFWWTKTKGRIILKFVGKEPEAKGIYKFWFEPLRKFSFLPGQFLQWTLPHAHADNRGTRRWFTISSAPDEDRVLLTTKIFDQPSTFKRALFELKPGTEISASDPDGDFVLPTDPADKLVFIAGGIGITPYRSMIKSLLDTKQSRDIILLYAAKTADEFSFRDLFEQAQQIGLRTIYLETDKTGFITADLIKKEIPDWKDRIFYVSGPEPMVEAYEKMLKETGIADTGLKTDFFPGYE